MKRDLLSLADDTANASKWTHDGLAHDLASHLRGLSDRRVWVDMQLGAAGSTRPDVYTMPCSFSRFTPIAYECKVSVSDFRADVTKGKYTDYLAYASGVIFACPAGLLKRDDIPKGAGLMTRGEDGWHTLKAPTLSKCPELPRSFWLKLVMDGERRDHERQAYMEEHCKRSLNEYAVQQKLRTQFGDVVAAAINDHLSQTTRRLDSLRHAISTRTAALEADLKRIDERRDAARQAEARECSEMLRDLAKTVGMEPDPANIRKMSNKLDAMIALAQESTTVKELVGIVQSISWGVKQFHEIEAALASRNVRGVT
ncbi:hypothetical protein [Paraburkholderia nemoris]|uniref:hypothetical protein n=1 Tax=Paraburkholderia nemoris TaxID=2793076 RepID=UPI001B02C671|nr:hypothetical protein [Paraburkholderia nemoris]CAE6838937.1 hypothetical protein R75777_06973 [Paraburkholderia nemoris]